MNGTVEVEMLEGLDLEHTPKCGCSMAWPDPLRIVKCPNFSVARSKATCPEHGINIRFVCNYHLHVVKEGTMSCGIGGCTTLIVYLGDT